ncbi:hypothetical protein RHMOL_Rhmol04G0170100 [Rhododendron molle]|uniref:Uncharacterized protein n=1 Tax=Rhododendron molle TaxID=49168 RepID=A0ACC0P3J2_RHOML|nr:hypothetical protein RHMOL_Rhmol04G0170100 [Rhododendron molle]
MSHTLLESFWTPACRLVSKAGAGGTSLSELLRGWLFIYLNCIVFGIKDKLCSFYIVVFEDPGCYTPTPNLNT